MADKQIIVIAGPNGAGKTTFAMRYLPSEASCLLYNSTGPAPVLIEQGGDCG